MTKKFHERFEEVKIDKNLALTNTLNRFVNMIFDWPNGYLGFVAPRDKERREIESFVVSYSGFGKRYEYHKPYIKRYLDDNIYQAMKMIEGLFSYVFEKHATIAVAKLNAIVQKIINMAEMDIGLRWKNGVFSKKGAELLDREIVDNALGWLKSEGFETVYEPYKDSLEHLMNSTKEPDRLHDGISNAFEALEGLAKIICENNRTLHKNQELFINRLGISSNYKNICRYGKSAQAFR